MSNDLGFQIVCANCGCLSVRIEEPLKSAREAVVHCGDCGASRGTVGALRDLAVQRYPAIAIATPIPAIAAAEQMANARHPSSKISRQYAELRRLRQRVALAEWLASERNTPLSATRLRKTDATLRTSRPLAPGSSASLDDETDQKTIN